MPMQTWMEQRRQIAAQDAYRHSRDEQRRFQEWKIAKERAADPLAPLIDDPFDEEEMERSRR